MPFRFSYNLVGGLSRKDFEFTNIVKLENMHDYSHNENFEDSVNSSLVELNIADYRENCTCTI